MENEIRSRNTVCRSVELGLRVIGVWPGTSCMILRKFFYILSLIVFQIFQYRHVIMHFGEQDLSFLMDALSTTLAYSLLLIKLIIFALKARVFDEIIACIVEDWKKRDVSDEYVMTRTAYICRLSSNLMISSYVASVFFYGVGTFMRRINDNQTDTRELILKMELPFEIKSTSVYIAVLVIQFVHQTSAAGTVSVLSALLLTLVLHACGQIDAMRRKLREITREDIEQGVSEDIVKAVIVRHQRIISFSENIEALFSNIALIQFVSNTLVICCLGFLIVISIGSPNGSTTLVKSILFYFVISLDSFIFCFAGECLSTKSKTIGDTAYESLWYHLKPSQNRNLFFMIVRSQKHLTLTVGKFVDLSLTQFSNIVKASASYVSVLHATY